MERSDFKDYNSTRDSSPLSVGQWIITMLLLAIPLVNIILLFVWSFGKNVNVNKQNFSRAELIFVAIGFALYLIFFITIGNTLMNSVPGGY